MQLTVCKRGTRTVKARAVEDQAVATATKMSTKILNQLAKCHVCQQWQDRPAKEWKTECGWRCGRSFFERRSVIAEGLVDEEYCTTCFDKDVADSD